MTYNNKLPYLPKGTCIWLIQKTGLTFKQIADFCGIHELEVKGVANGDVNWHVQAEDPIVNGQLLKEEIERCKKDPNAKLTLFISEAQELMTKNSRKNRATYTPISKRQDKPNAIAWLVKYYPDLKDSKISKLIGTTKTTIKSIRDKTHKDIKNIKASDPVTLGFITQTNLNEATKNLKLDEEKKPAETNTRITEDQKK